MAVAPARDILAFCDTASVEGIGQFQQVVARIFPGGDHLISDRLYRREPRRWVPLEGLSQPALG